MIAYPLAEAIQSAVLLASSDLRSPLRRLLPSVLLPLCGAIAAIQCGEKAAPPPTEGGATDAALLNPSPGPDPCSGLVQDRAAHPMTPLSKPAVGQTLIDPQFGTRLRRITAVPVSEGENAVIMPVYSTVQAWNADESKIILWHRGKDHELYDGRTYAFIRSLPLVSPTDIEQVLWDPVDPDVLYYPSNYNAVPNFMRYRVSTNSNELVRHFAFCPVDWGSLLSLGSHNPAYLSWGPQSKVVGLQCGNLKFLYDIASDSVLGSATIDTASGPRPGPSGTLAYVDGRVYDQRLRFLRALNLANPLEHSCLGRSAVSGHDVYASVVFDPPRGGSTAADVGTLVAHDLETGARRVVVGIATGFPYPPSTTHISAIAHRRPGWVAVSVVGDPRGSNVLDGELLVANFDTGEVCRVGHHRSWAREGDWNYWAEPHVVISPTATRLLFGSDWGNGSSVDTYVVELPAYSRN